MSARRRSKNRALYWVLREGGRYLRGITAIGPGVTSRRGEAERFRSKRKAMQSPAYSFALTNFCPEAVR